MRKQKVKSLNAQSEKKKNQLDESSSCGSIPQLKSKAHSHQQNFDFDNQKSNKRISKSLQNKSDDKSLKIASSDGGNNSLIERSQEQLKLMQLSGTKYDRIRNEMMCPICRNILTEPVWLPCMHVFCHKCLRFQIVKEKSNEKLASCAECKKQFSHRSLIKIPKFESILQVFKSFREDNQLCTQIPSSFQIFDPLAAKQKLINKQKQIQEQNNKMKESEMSDEENQIKEATNNLIKPFDQMNIGEIQKVNKQQDKQKLSVLDEKQEQESEESSIKYTVNQLKEILALKQRNTLKSSNLNNFDQKEERKLNQSISRKRQIFPVKKYQKSSFNKKVQQYNQTSLAGFMQKNGEIKNDNSFLKKNNSLSSIQNASSRQKSQKQPKLQIFERGKQKKVLKTKEDQKRSNSYNQENEDSSQNVNKTELQYTMLENIQICLLQIHIDIFKDHFFIDRSIKQNSFICAKSKSNNQLLIVSSQLNPARSQKTLQAIVNHVPIVGFQWVIDSQEQGILLPWQDYQFKINTSVDIKSLFSKFNFYFQNVSHFNNNKINKSSLTFDFIKMIIFNCGGQIKNTLIQSKFQDNNSIEKILIKLKCSQKFDRQKTDQILEELKAQNQFHNEIKQNEDALLNEKKEILLDFHWLTDSVFQQVLLPFYIYQID